jgi:hypothetical protein
MTSNLHGIHELAMRNPARCIQPMNTAKCVVSYQEIIEGAWHALPALQIIG